MSFDVRSDPFPALLDTNTLFPATLRDTLFIAAERELYRLYWSDAILAELQRTLVEKGPEHGGTDAIRAARTVQMMREAFPEALVEGWQYLEPAMRNHRGDRHVLAAAVRAGVSVIVTDNTKHFPPDATAQYDIMVKTADAFLCDRFDLYPDEMLEVLYEQAGTKNRPPLTVRVILDRLVGCGCSTFVGRVREDQTARSRQ